MFSHRIACSTVLAFVIAATAPGTALAMPIVDPQPQPAVPPQPVTVVREVPADQTLALVLSGAALLVAVGTAGYSGRAVRPTRRRAQTAAERT